MADQNQWVSGPFVAVVTYTRSWDFNPRVAGQRAVGKHADALRRLGT